MSPTAQPTLDWNDCRRPAWDRLLASAGRSSLEQSWSYGDAMAARTGVTVERAVIRHAGAPIAVVQLFRQRALGLVTIVRIVRGPLWVDARLADGVDAPVRAAVHRMLRAAVSLRRSEALFWMPELLDTPANQALMRAAGTRRMVTGYSSAWLDLSAGEDTLRAGLAGKWRNALVAAERRDTRVTVADDGRGLAELMVAYGAFRRRGRFVGPPGALVTAIAEAGRHTKDALVVSALAGGDDIAGVVLIRHGVSATYFVSWTSPEGRRRNAHNLLLWRGIQVLAKSGTVWLDLGGLNTAAAPGIARFKLGLRPEIFTLAGTYF